MENSQIFLAIVCIILIARLIYIRKKNKDVNIEYVSGVIMALFGVGMLFISFIILNR